MAGQRNSYGKRSHEYSDSGGGNKRRNSGPDKESFSIGSDDTVYRYLCPVKKIGSIIGRGGEIVKQLRADTKSKIRIGETVPGSDDRVVTIYSTSEEENDFDEGRVCPAQDALFKVHEKIVSDDRGAASDDDRDRDEAAQVTAKLLVPSDQIGCIIGKGGQIVQTIRSETGAQIRILKDDHLPSCALGTDELVQISGEAPVVRKALFQIASRLHDNPSRSQHSLASAVPNAYASSGSHMGGGGGGSMMGMTPLMGPYGGSDSRDWQRNFYPPPRDDSSSKEFALRLVCSTPNIGAVIGKGGAIINQIRQESGAGIKVDSSASEGGDDCLILITAKEFFEDTFSPAIDAALRLQPRCSDKAERDSGHVSYTTRLLVPTSRIGCLIGKGGSIITEMRKITKANIRILTKEDLPKVAASDDEMVQISGDLDIAKDALIQVTSRLRANLFERERESAVPAYVPVMPYVPMSTDAPDGLRYDSRDSKRHSRGHSYSGSGYGGSSDLPPGDGYGGYGDIQGGGSGYGSYGGYSSGRSGGSGLSGHNPVSRRKSYY